MIKIATAECFTHGKVGREIHSLAQGYEDEFGPDFTFFYNDLDLKFDFKDLSLISALFIPTLDGVKKILKIDDIPEPFDLIKGIKVYKEEEDKEVATLMAKHVKDISGADIGIGTTAGIGKGGIAIVTNELSIVTSSDVSADLIHPDFHNLDRRQKSAIKKTIRLLIFLLNRDFEKIKNFADLNFY